MEAKNAVDVKILNFHMETERYWSKYAQRFNPEWCAACWVLTVQEKQPL